MIYVYDIILNWSSEDIYDFFEWELNDEIEHIKRIPFFKIDSSTFTNMENYKIKIDKEILSKIKNLTEVYSADKNNSIMYSSLFTDGVRVIAIEFNSKGESIYKSKLLLDEEQDILMLSTKMTETKIAIEKLNKWQLDPFTTRYEKEIRRLLKVEIEDCYKKGNFDKLRYLYYECFGKNQDDVDLIYNKLLESINSELDNKHSKLYEVVKLSYQNKG